MRNSQKPLRCGTRAAVLALVLMLVCGPGSALAALEGTEKTADPGTVLVDVMAGLKTLEMPPVAFPHPKHTETLLKRGKDCTVCHEAMSAGFNFRKLPGKRSAMQTEQAFHKNCITCHEAMDDGPQAGECRRCHEPLKPYAGSGVPFDKSLHALHVGSKNIAAPEGTPDGSPNCGACHHVLDPATQKPVWAPGQEDACAACHAPETVGTVLSLKDASHRSCVTCHVQQIAAEKAATESAEKAAKNERKDKKKDKRDKRDKHTPVAGFIPEFKGPVLCSGCHAPVAQAEFPKLRNVPRLMRGQPDATVILPANNAGVQVPLPGSGMDPVVFNHKAHEAAAESCRVCHHVRIDDKGCAACHTVEGRPEGQYVTQSVAMHNSTAQASCVGCHQLTTLQNKDCAGCHTLFHPEKTGFSGDKSSCVVCHAPVRGLPSVADGQAAQLDAGTLQKIAEENLAARKTAKPLSPEDVPVTVTIGILADDFDPAVFPHRKIYAALRKGIENNTMAAAFHTSPQAVCAACHHNVPAANLLQPPRCVTCHSETMGSATPGQPMPLKQAYHQQCIACHEAMNIKPAATDCAGCHTPRPEKPAAGTAR